MLRDTYAEINLNHLEHNIATLKAAADKPLMAVVKADGYGHGAPQVAKKAWECGIEWMAVSNPDEALEIRDICPKARILVLSSVLDTLTLSSKNTYAKRPSISTAFGR